MGRRAQLQENLYVWSLFLSLHVESLAIRAPTLSAEVRSVRRLVTDLGEFGRVKLLIPLKAGLEREVEDTAGQHRPFHRIRSLTRFEHDLDILYQTPKVVVGAPLLKIHQRGDRLRLPYDVHRHGEILNHSRHYKRCRA